VYLLIAAAVLAFLVGLDWLDRIGGLGDDPGRPIFRYRREDPPRPGPPQRRRPAWPSLPDPIGRRATIRWLVTRLELTIAILCTAIAGTLWLIGPLRTLVMTTEPDLSALLAMVGLGGCLIGLVWMLLHRADPDTGPSIWRSRDP
jgi:hypothetical protein